MPQEVTIELVWARIKGNVGRQYSISTTLEVVYQRLRIPTDISKAGCVGIARDLLEITEQNAEQLPVSVERRRSIMAVVVFGSHPPETNSRFLLAHAFGSLARRSCWNKTAGGTFYRI